MFAVSIGESRAAALQPSGARQDVFAWVRGFPSLLHCSISPHGGLSDMKDGHTRCSQDPSAGLAAASGSEETRAFTKLPTADNKSLESAQQSMAALIEGVVQTNLRAVQEMLDVTTPSRFAELQQRFIRDYMEALINGTFTLVQAIQETAKRAPPRGV